MRKKNIKYSYMAGSRQHFTCSFMRACLRCLPLVDTDVLLLHVHCMYLLLLLLWCCCCIAVGCGVATSAALVHEETEETKKMKNKHIREIEKTRTRKYKKKGYKAKKSWKGPAIKDGGGVQAGTCERPGRCQPSPLRKKHLSK